MPLWKKASNKGNRISKLVSDHLHHSPKHGGSLVVETGFPTSLVDLFDKNRDCLRKSSKKKRFHSIPDPIPIPACPSPSSTTLATPSSSGRPNSPLLPPISPSFLGLASARCSPPNRVVGNGIGEIQEGGVVGDGGESEVVAASGVVVAMLKVFLVVVLALGTEKFVVGITMSAFLLVLMDYAGKHLCWLIKPCVDVTKSLVERGLCVFGIKRGKSIDKEDGCGLNGPNQGIRDAQPKNNSVSPWLIEGRKMNDAFQEIQIMQPSPDLVPSTREIQSVKYEFDARSGKEKWVHEEIGKKKEVVKTDETYPSDVVNVKSQRSHKETSKLKEFLEKDEVYASDVVDAKHGHRRGKIRSKIKKFVSKKLHGSKRRQMGSKNEVSSSSGENAASVDEEDGEQRGCGYDDKSLLLSNGRCGDQVDVGDAICRSRELHRADMEDSIVREDVGTKTEGKAWRNSGWLILIAIVLVGLVWSRVLALALALSWFLLMNWSEIRRKFMKSSPEDKVSIRS